MVVSIWNSSSKIIGRSGNRLQMYVPGSMAKDGSRSGMRFIQSVWAWRSNKLFTKACLAAEHREAKSGANGMKEVSRWNQFPSTCKKLKRVEG
uniref:Uncharacterized protein n=1 Tax=Romanomermis culicivorax TaxID=13658 RepID=A0A915KIK5_ROMCU